MNSETTPRSVWLLERYLDGNRYGKTVAYLTREAADRRGRLYLVDDYRLARRVSYRVVENVMEAGR